MEDLLSYPRCQQACLQAALAEGESQESMCQGDDQGHLSMDLLIHSPGFLNHSSTFSSWWRKDVADTHGSVADMQIITVPLKKACRKASRGLPAAGAPQASKGEATECQVQNPVEATEFAKGGGGKKSLFGG